MCYEERCPICDYPLRYCECANKSVLSEGEEMNLQVALEHLYLLSEEQRKHLIEIESVWEIGYTNDREDIVERLKEQAEEREEAKEKERKDRELLIKPLLELEDNTTDLPAPKPCPRCGTSVIPFRIAESFYTMNCGCTFAQVSTGWQMTEKEAIETWNITADELVKRKQNKED